MSTAFLPIPPPAGPVPVPYPNRTVKLPFGAGITVRGV
jgi:hypothetical protein